MLFYGECRVEISSKTKGAAISLDSIPLGENEVAANVPCGEKEIRVAKAGFVPYRTYLKVIPNEILRVSVELEKHKRKPNFALSGQLIDQIRRGIGPIDPWGPQASRLALEEDRVKKADLAAASARANGQGSALPSAATSGSGASSVSEAELNSVEYWR